MLRAPPRCHPNRLINPRIRCWPLASLDDVNDRRKMITRNEDPKLWRPAVVAGIVSVSLLAAAIVPIGALIAPFSLVASITSLVYGARSVLRKEEKKHLAVLGMLLSLVAPGFAAYLVLFVKAS